MSQPCDIRKLRNGLTGFILDPDRFITQLQLQRRCFIWIYSKFKYVVINDSPSAEDLSEKQIKQEQEPLLYCLIYRSSSLLSEKS